jgi:pyridoxal phosphate enzyme (YggS family)
MTAPPVDPDAVARNAAELRDRINHLSGGRQVTIVAVTKGFGADAVRAALDCGFSCVGENYAQELLSKAEQLTSASELHWHFLGQLQRNKIRSLAPVVDVWQSVDRIALIDAISERAPGAKIFIQANLSGEPHKGGAALVDVPALVDHARDVGLEVQGLMGVGPEGPPEGARGGFRSLVELADTLGVEQRSIGMSADLEVALQEGSTMVRVGSGLFGARPPR